MTRHNELGLPIGEALADWEPRPMPPATPMEGQYCRLEILDSKRHGEALYQANREDTEDRIWTYMTYGPFPTLESYQQWLNDMTHQADPQFFAVIEKQSQQPLGVASFLRIDPDMGSLEVGHINYSPRLQRTIAATETMYLMMKRAFDELGYRRYEWKCDSLNAKSRKAAIRLGFTFEGIFRQARVYKNRSRDDAWYAIVDKDWPRIKAAFQKWLHPDNFVDGVQKSALSIPVDQ